MSLNHDTAINPFDDEGHAFWVLVNAQGDHSLWPEFAERPAGWDARFGPAPRAQCLAHVETHWQALQPFVSPATACTVNLD